MEDLEQSGPQEMQTWRWPERDLTGPRSSPQPSLPSGPQLDLEQVEQEPGQLPGEGARSVAIRSTVVTLVSTILSALTSFGFGLDEAKSTALISVVTAASALVALFMAGRRGRG
jgi:hypothetical protein